MKWKGLIFLFLILAAGCCTRCNKPPETPVAQLETLQASQEPGPYQVVYRDRGTWVDPMFVAIDRRGEFLLDKKTERRR